MRFIAWFFGILGILMVVGVIVGSIVFSVMAHNNKSVVTGVVDSTYNKRSGKSDTFYVVVKMDDGSKQVFENEDSIFEGKHNSADVQASLDKGKRYEFKVYGYRVNFFSIYKNIYDDPEPVKEANK